MTTSQGAIMAKAALVELGVIEPRPCASRSSSPTGAARAAPVGPLDAADPMSHPHPELDRPGPLPDGGLRIVPLGGLGEIGRNMTVFEHGGQLLVVDCGVLFPEDHQPGVDLILPDFDYIRDRLDDVEGVVLTHGHEDHIGAVPYLLRPSPTSPSSAPS